MPAVTRYLIIAGLILITAGLIYWAAGGKLNWIGKLPGDIHIKKDNFSLYIPLTTMLLASLLITFAAWLFKKF